jgi:hypothetical protein
MADRPEHHNTPRILLDVAFQPAARGEPTHFVAGNIRIVGSARKLLHQEERDNIMERNWMVAHLLEMQRKYPTDDDWKAWLLFLHGLEEEPIEFRGHRERLVVTGQAYYSCLRCGGFV